jgi:methionyl-tRNA synthetase
LDGVLFHASEALRVIAILLAPVMPRTAEVIWQQLGMEGRARDSKLVELDWGTSAAGKTMGTATALFPRLDSKAVMAKLESVMDAKHGAAPAASAQQPATAPAITIDDFAKVDLRVATVLEAERVKGADKLLRLVVDVGFEKRQILAGIATAYAPESLIGRKVVIVANLQPRKMRGLESNGMVVAASVGDDGKPVLAGFIEDIQNGARLK